MKPRASKLPAVRRSPPSLPPGVQPIVAVAAPLPIKDRPAHRRNYSARPRLSTQCIVIHCTDGHEGTRKDDDVAAMFAKADLSPRRSCHYVVDSDSVTRCMPDTARAWHCGRRGNAISIGIELCGRARQTRLQWLDALSLPMLQIAARLVSDLCAVHQVPVEVVTPVGLRAGRKGITTHACISEAFGESRHWDPGPHFPLGDFVVAVSAAMDVA